MVEGVPEEGSLLTGWCEALQGTEMLKNFLKALSELKLLKYEQQCGRRGAKFHLEGTGC